MAKPIVDDELWEIIEPLLPPAKPRRFRYPGRKPISNRQAFTGILFVLRSGIPWEKLPQELGCGCGMSCWRKLRDWTVAGVWPKIHQELLTYLRQADQLDWSRAVIDSSSVRAVFGGRRRDRTQPIAAKQARNTMCSPTPAVFRSPPPSPLRMSTM
jgi:transposase